MYPNTETEKTAKIGTRVPVPHAPFSPSVLDPVPLPFLTSPTVKHFRLHVPVAGEGNKAKVRWTMFGSNKFLQTPNTPPKLSLDILS
jgi:hypothetical protein